MTTQEKRQQQRLQWREQEARDIEASKAKMAAEHGLERNAKFERAWQLAWEYGHSSGIAEVESYFAELTDLLKP